MCWAYREQPGPGRQGPDRNGRSCRWSLSRVAFRNGKRSVRSSVCCLCSHQCNRTHQVRDKTSTAYSLDSHLCRLGLLLVVNNWDVGDVNLHKVVLSSSDAQLSKSLDERHRFDVAHGSSKLDNADIRLLTSVVDWNFSDSLDPILNCLDNMRHNLYGMSKIVTASLLVDNELIDLAGCDVVVAGQCDVEVALVVAEIQIDFSTIVKNEAFTMPVSREPMSNHPWLSDVLRTLSGSWFLHRRSSKGLF